ncbi:MAG: kojibiose phosphorylase [Fimbriimonadales bacterium]
MQRDTWTVVKTDPSERAIESANTVFTVCNGYLALKGNLLENRTGRHPSTFVAAVFGHADYFAFVRPVSYERRHFDPKYFDDAGPNPSIANLPDPLMLRVFVGNRELSFRRGTVSGFRQVYDLRRGVYAYRYEIEDERGRTTRVETERFCDMRFPHRAYVRYTVTPLDYSEEIRIESGIDGTIRSNLKEDKQYEVVGAWAEAGVCRLDSRTYLKGQHVRMAVATEVDGLDPDESLLLDSEVYSVHRVTASVGVPVRVTKFIAVGSDEDARHGAACDEMSELRAARAEGYDAALVANSQWWDAAWQRMDVQIEGDDLAQLYLRFCMMHLISAAPRHSDKLSIPCKLLTGEWYQGTVFYDTDLYIEPVFLFTWPQIARACLNYRYVGLEPGRTIAKRFGWKGAKLAWQAGPYGEEELGYWWRYTLTNIHINGDVAYSLMQYWYATHDIDFLAHQGIEMLVEFSRFYVSRATHDPESDTYHFDGVAGPDEGHCESTDNFYTNILARKTLEWTVDVLRLLSKERAEDYSRVMSEMGVTDDEIREWSHVAARIVYLLDAESGLIEQYRGFHRLLPIPEDLLEKRKEWWTPVFPYQAIHQPDVVMALVMFRDEFPDKVLRANYEYYKERCMNFSSMSFVINSIMGKLMGDMDYAYEQFMISAGEDLDESLTGRHDVNDGIHGTASGGAWLAAVSGFGGVFLSERGLTVDPQLPQRWKSLSFGVVYRGQELRFHITHQSLHVSVDERASSSVELAVRGKPVVLGPGESRVFTLT